jgi:SAM-dependent methyltransferase
MSEPAAPEKRRELFDGYADQYEAACHQGLALSGESREYFSEQRVAYTAAWLRRLGCEKVHRLADFGCGPGHSTPHFQRYFPDAALLGLDVSTASIALAEQRYGTAGRFAVLTSEPPEQDQQLVYCNGVFHHIAPLERPLWMRTIQRLLQPGGYFALWENNPWNPGTRLVMRRIPFDRDALPLSPPEARGLLLQAGFRIVGTRYRFYFPRFLAWLRGLERWAVRLPLGAQYCVLARKPSEGESA